MCAIHTLKTKREFDFVYRNGRRWSSQYLVLFSCKVSRAPRVGFSVSRKVGNACKRNFIKRRFRALCRLHQVRLKSFSIVFVPGPKILESSFRDLERDLLRCLDFLERCKRSAKSYS